MFDFVTRMFVVVDVDRILCVVHVLIKRLDQLIEIRKAANNKLEILRNETADRITFNLTEIERARVGRKLLARLLDGEPEI